MSTRVLVVDDDPMIRKAISKVLLRDGYDVATAEDAAPALEACRLHLPDIIVVDYNMPTCGLEVVTKVKALYGASVFVAMLTGEDSDSMRDECLGAGADAVMVKPIAPTELREQVGAAAASLKMQLSAAS